MTEFSVWLNERIEAAESLRKVAQYAEISPSTLTDLRYGRTAPRYATVLRLARYFKVSHKFLLNLASLAEIQPEAILLANIESSVLNICVRRMADLPKAAQDVLAEMVNPIVAHIERDHAAGLELSPRRTKDVLAAASHPLNRKHIPKPEEQEVLDRYADESESDFDDDASQNGEGDDTNTMT